MMSRHLPHAAVVLGTLILALLPSPLSAQIASLSTEPHLRIGARQAAMADTYVGEAFDVSAMNSNPAALSFLETRSVVGTGVVEKAGEGTYMFTEGVAVPFRVNGQWSGGLSVSYHHPGVKSTGSPVEDGFWLGGADLGIAYRVSRRFSVGIEGSLRLAHRANGVNTAVYSSGGIFYQPSPEWSYGASFQGLGTTVLSPYDAPDAPRLAGTGYPRQSLQVGFSYRYPSRKPERTLTVAFAGQLFTGDREVVLRMGMEWFPVKFAGLRAGYWYGPHTVAGKYGAGFRLGRLMLDYAISPSLSEPQFHHLSLSYLLGILP